MFPKDDVTFFGANNKYLSPPDLGWMKNPTKVAVCTMQDSLLRILA